MIQLKATCLRCGGAGYAISNNPCIKCDIPIICSDCGGKGILILDEEKWDIELEDIVVHKTRGVV